jgi:Bacteriophage HK97-gp10, putative tail-component
MAYRASGTLTQLVNVEDDIDEVELALCLRMAYEIQEKVRRYTPTAIRPPKVTASVFAAERSRRPGTLKDSWEIGHLAKLGNTSWIEVYTEDPIAPYVEYDTRPHPIRARPGSVLRFRSTKTGEVVYAAEVLHPGTTGVHMLARACAEVAADADRLMRGVVRRQWGRPRAPRTIAELREMGL